jgi:hypothetical protein
MPVGKVTPEWLPRLAEAIAAQRLNDYGTFEPLEEDQAQILRELQDQLNRESADDEWVTWSRWFLTDCSTRTISPFSKITVPEYIENRIKENTAKSLDEAEEIALGNEEVLNRIAVLHAALLKRR